MPVSKKRKASNGKRRVYRLERKPLETSRWTASLNGSRLPFLKNDPDFLALVKIGRVLNAVTFALKGVADYQDDKTVTGTRQFRRGLLILAGYLHQSLQLIKSMQGRYLTVPEYQDLRLMVHDAKYKQSRDYLKAIRNITAFHLDEYDEVTRQTLAGLKPERHNLMSGDDQTPMTFYFEFADYIDFAFLVGKFRNGRTWDETARDIVKSILRFAGEFILPCHTFMQYLVDQSKLKDHIEKKAPFRL